MNDERQSQLLAAYLEALQGDPHAVPPPALDPALASMARRLHTSRALSPDAAARERVWQRALATAQMSRASANGRSAHPTDKETLMTAIPRALPKRRMPFSLAPIAAAVALVATLAMLMIVRPPSGPSDIQPGMLVNPEQEATATPLLMPTATPFPATVVPSVIHATPTLALIEHRVQAGEVLEDILRRYSVVDPAAVSQFIIMNPAAREGMLTEGTVLLIPMTGMPLPVRTVPFASPTLVPSHLDPMMLTATEIIAQASQTAAAVFGVPVTSTPIPVQTRPPIIAEPLQPTLVPGASDPNGMPAPAPTVVPPAWMMAEPEPITLGETVTGELGASQQPAFYTFIADATGPVLARARSEDLSTLYLGFDVAQGGVAEGRFGGGGGGGGTMSHEASAVRFVYAGDRVTVIVNNAQPESGGFRLTVQQVEAQTLRYGDSVSGEINGEQPLGHYVFSGAQGDRVTVRAAGVNSYDTTLTLMSMTPEQSIVYDDDGGPGFDPEIASYALPSSGEYAVLVEPGVTTGGRYTLTLERVEPLSLDNGPQQVSFNSKFEPVLVFSGEAGSTRQVDVRAVSGIEGARAISILVFENGFLLADISRDFGPSSVAAQPAAGALLASGTVTLAETGPVTVLVSAATSLAGGDGPVVEVEVVPVG